MPRLLKISISFIALFLVTIGISEYSSPAYSDTSGAPATRTGSPGDGGLSCTSCHAGTASTQAGLITSDIPVSGYVPGNTYTITGTVTSAGKTKFGFEISPQNLAGALKGTLTLINTTTTKLIGGNKYVTHKSTGTSFPSGTATWSFQWTAPIAGTGDVTFYGAFNITNSSNSTSGDIIKLSTLLVSEDVFAGINDPIVNESDWTVYPNPTKEKLNFKTENTSEILGIEIMDITGKQVLQDAKVISNELNVSELENGIYLLHIKTAEGIVIKKFIKN